MTDQRHETRAPEAGAWRRTGGDDRGRVDAPATPAAPSAAAPSAGMPGAAVPAPQAPAAAAAAGALTTAGGTPLFPTAAQNGGSLASLVGQEVAGRAVRVLSVPADEGFWVGANDTDRVWVKLIPSGESPLHVVPGQLLDLSGPVVAHGADFAGNEGVTAAEGADQLTRAAAHVEANQDTVEVVGTR